MPTAGSLRVGQVAPQTYWVTVSQGGSLASFNFTTVSAASIKLVKPSGATQTWATSLSAQTATGLTATHTLALGDLDEAGVYTAYLLMTVPGGTIRSETGQFYVAEEFAEVDSNEVPGWFVAGAVISGGGGSTPTGTGIPHIVGGAQNAAASLIVDADVTIGGISPNKLAASGTDGHVIKTVSGGVAWGAAPAPSFSDVQTALAAASGSVNINSQNLVDVGGSFLKVKVESGAGPFNNYDPGDADIVCCISPTTVNFTGLVAPSSGRSRRIHIISDPGGSVGATHQSIASTAANRLYLYGLSGGAIGGTLQFVYNTQQARWCLGSYPL